MKLLIFEDEIELANALAKLLRNQRNNANKE